MACLSTFSFYPLTLICFTKIMKQKIVNVYLHLAVYVLDDYNE